MRNDDIMRSVEALRINLTGKTFTQIEKMVDDNNYYRLNSCVNYPNEAGNFTCYLYKYNMYDKIEKTFILVFYENRLLQIEAIYTY